MDSKKSGNLDQPTSSPAESDEAPLNAPTIDTEPEECGICNGTIGNPETWKDLEGCSHKICTYCFPRLPRTGWRFFCASNTFDLTHIPRVKCPYCRQLSDCEPQEISHSGNAVDLDRAQRLLTMGKNYFASTPTASTLNGAQNNAENDLIFTFCTNPNGEFELLSGLPPMGFVRWVAEILYTFQEEYQNYNFQEESEDSSDENEDSGDESDSEENDESLSEDETQTENGTDTLDLEISSEEEDEEYGSAPKRPRIG